MRTFKLPWTKGDKIGNYVYEGDGLFRNNLEEFVLAHTQSKKQVVLSFMKNHKLRFETPSYPNFAAFFFNNKKYWYLDATDPIFMEQMKWDFLNQTPWPGHLPSAKSDCWEAIFTIMYEYWLFNHANERG